MDYNKACEELASHTNYDWFKPETGTHTVVLLEEPEEMLKTFKQGTPDEETKPIVRMYISVNSICYNWDIGKSKGYGGIYGQLMLLGKQKGRLAGEKFTLLVKRVNNKNDYTVMEVIPLLQEINKQKQQGGGSQA